MRRLACETDRSHGWSLLTALVNYAGRDSHEQLTITELLTKESSEMKSYISCRMGTKKLADHPFISGITRSVGEPDQDASFSYI